MRIFLTARRVALATLLILVLLLGFLPRMLSTKWVYSHWVDQFRLANFQLQIDSVSLRWLSPLRIDGISVRQLSDGSDASDLATPSELIRVQSIQSSVGLLGILLNKEDLGTWTIWQPTFDIELLEKGTNLQDLIQASRNALHIKKQTDKSDTEKQGRRLTIVVHEASIAVKRLGDTNPLVVVPPFDTQLTYLGNQIEQQLEIQPTQWLDHVKLTPELMDLGLQLALPSLAKATWIDGEVSLSTEQTNVPLKTPLMSQTSARLTLHNVRAGLESPALKSVAQTMGRMVGMPNDGEVHVIDNDVVNVKLSDGAVEHSGFRFGLPKVDPELQIATSGRVQLIDHQLDAKIQFPIPLKLLARKETVRDLGIPSITLPVHGTLEEPQIDWTSMRGDTTDVLAEVSAALGDDSPVRSTVIDLMHGLSAGNGDEAIGAAAEVVSGLRDRLKQRRQKSTEEKRASQEVEDEASDTTKTNSSKHPLLDRLRRFNQAPSE